MRSRRVSVVGGVARLFVASQYGDAEVVELRDVCADEPGGGGENFGDSAVRPVETEAEGGGGTGGG